MGQQERGGAPARDRVDELVDVIWEESARLETVLVVHAYGSLREALARTLEHYGYRALEACDREQALRIVRADRPAVVLLDLALSGGEGPSLASTLASRDDSREIPVLALTSEALSQEVLRGCGAREALVMPIEQKDLLAAIDRSLEPIRRRAAGNLRIEPSDEQCRLPLEDRLRSDHLTLFFRFPASRRVEIHPGNEMRIRSFSARLAALGIQPDVQMEGGDLLLRYELTIADGLSLEPDHPVDELFTDLAEAYPELATRPDALRGRLEELESEYRRLQRVAS